jgi:hypothetical protein
MHRLVRALLIVAVVAPLIGGVGQAQAQQSPVALPPSFFGMVARDPFYDWDSMPGVRGPNRAAQDEMGRRMAEMGVRWVRLEFIGDNGAVNFQKYDYFINEVAPRHNFQVLGLLATNILQGDGRYWQPHLMNTEPLTDTLRPQYGGGLNTYMRRWLDESLRIADRYKGKVAAWELFNEANRLLGDGTSLPPGLSYAGLNPVRLGRLHAKFYRLCKNTDGSQAITRCPEGTLVVLGGLHPKGTSARRDNSSDPERFTYTDREYLAEMYGPGGFQDFRDADPLRRWPVDAIGYHPYPEEISLAEGRAIDIDLFKIEQRMNKVRTKLTELGDGQRPFWITEIGYNVGFYKHRVPGAADTQARFMEEIYARMWQRRDVEVVFWFKYEDFPPADVVTDDNGNAIADPQRWGVVRIPFTANGRVNGVPCAGGACYEPTGRPAEVRPAYFTYRRLAGLPLRQIYLPGMARGAGSPVSPPTPLPTLPVTPLPVPTDDPLPIPAP